MSDIDYNSCFPGMITGDACFRFNDKDNNENEQFLFDNWWREIIALYGQKITYYANAYSIVSADNFYGENPTRAFAPGVEMIVGVELNNNATTLTRYGFSSDDEVTVTVHIETFYSDMLHLSGNVYMDQYDQIEPKSGDVFTLTEYGRGRPGNRGPVQYEVTDRVDNDIATINQLGGYYVWRLKAKRFEYSFEPGLSAERGNDQVFDDTNSCVLSGVGMTTLSAKKYDYIVDIDSKTNIYNMSAYLPTDIYGEY